jgi:signal transduction histidine kinase
MKGATKLAAKSRKTEQAQAFQEAYRKSLSEYLRGPSEEALRHAYELGRRAVSDEKSLLELVSTYHEAVGSAVLKAQAPKEAGELLGLGCEYLMESVSPYEMAHRGFQDAVKALRRLNEVLEEEIKRIAHSVHDEAGQLLVAVHLALAEGSQGLPPAQEEHLGKIRELLNQVEGQLRRFSHELRPAILDDLGWIPAVRFLAEGLSRRHNLPIEVRAKFTARLPASVEIALYRTVQEALTNAGKHARAKHVVVDVQTRKNALECLVQDDGVGFSPRGAENGKRDGIGLIAMRERITAIGGTLSIDSGVGRGTKVIMRFPLENRK